MRFLSAQLEAYLTDDLWLRHARHANAMAARLAEGIAPHAEILRRVDANIVFVRFPPPLAAALQRDGFSVLRLANLWRRRLSAGHRVRDDGGGRGRVDRRGAA